LPPSWASIARQMLALRGLALARAYRWSRWMTCIWHPMAVSFASLLLAVASGRSVPKLLLPASASATFTADFCPPFFFPVHHRDPRLTVWKLDRLTYSVASTHIIPIVKRAA